MLKSSQQVFTLDALSKAIGLAALMASATVSYAQDENTQGQEEELVVTGIRAGLMRSIDAKRVARNIVDTVSSEDIGKFPDNNIAESLARVPGVSIQRDSGEGSKISIRGLGPDFSLVTFNGRQVASEEQSRGFNLDTLATDMVKGLDVYKSSNAKLTEGGLGGTVDIRTFRPFDASGLKAVLNVKAINTVSSGETEPQVSGLYSQTFSDDRFGVLGSFNYYNRTQQTAGVSTWTVLTDSNSGWAQLPGENSKQAATFGVSDTDDVRERLTFSLVGQARIGDSIELTADYMHNKFDWSREGAIVNMPLDWGFSPNSGLRDVEYSEPDEFGQRTLIKFTKDDGNFENNYIADGRDVTSEVVGLNMDWQITGDLSAEFDGFYSTSIDENKDLKYNLITRRYPSGANPDDPDSLLSYVYDYSGGGDYPLLTREDGSFDGLNADPSDAGEWLPSDYIRSGTYVDAENSGLKADFIYLVDSIDTIDNIEFGAHWAKNKKLSAFYRNYDRVLAGGDLNIEKLFADNADYNTNAGRAQLTIPEELFTIREFQGGLSGVPTQYFDFDPEAYTAFLSDPNTLAQLETSSNLAPGEAQALVDQWGFGTHKDGSETDVTETISAIYANVNFEAEYFSATAGLRYVKTDLESAGTFPLVVNVIPKQNPLPDDPEGILEAVYASGGAPVSESLQNVYHNLLPSFDATINITSDILLRTAWSKTLTRPNMGDLNPAYAPTSLFEDERRGVAGNPFLKPYESTNADLSLEWYYSDDSMVALAVFEKEIQDWILPGQEFISDEYFDLENSQYNEFIMSAPANVDRAGVQGVEFNWVQTFDFGLGYQITKTWVDSSVDADAAVTMVGISDTSNVTVFYEANTWEVRAAYNSRDGYLQDPNLFGAYGPLYVKDYNQLDLSANWDVTDNVNLYVEAVNVLDEAYAEYMWSEPDWRSYYETGPRYSLGARITF